MFQEIAAVLGPQATCAIAASARPGAAVRPVPRRRHVVIGRLLSMRPGRGR